MARGIDQQGEVGMAVDIDEPRRDEQALGVQYVRAAGVGFADFVDHSVRDADVRLHRFAPRTVEYGSRSG